MIIDCHCHAETGDSLTGSWDTTAPIIRHLQHATESSIDRTVIVAAFHSDYGLANAKAARIVASRPNRLLGFVGIKAHRYDTRLSREICEVARHFRIPIMYDPIGEVAVAELVAHAYPDVDFILPHLGNFSDDWRAQSGLIDHLMRHPNIYADISDVRRFDILEEAVARAGARKILFGSNGPWLHPGLELAKAQALKLAPADETAVLGGNLTRLLDKGIAKRTRTGGAPPVRHVSPPAPRPARSLAPRGRRRLSHSPVPRRARPPDASAGRGR